MSEVNFRSEFVIIRYYVDIYKLLIPLLFRVNVGNVWSQESPVFIPGNSGGREGPVGHFTLEFELASLRDLLTASCFQLRLLN